MWDKHWERVDSFLKKWKMVQEGDSILLGISGGADSVCLARYFLARREALSLKLYAVHINHMLRGEEAKRDEEFVQDFCHKWNLSLNVEYRNIKEESRQKKCSEEEAGRIARYECFEKYAKEYHCGKIAVAHHQNDAAETILFRMLRGTGPQGMAGILPVNGKIIRPFLCLSREEIMDILQNIGQNYVDDSTNTNEEYSRNYIRHRILPEMEHVNQKAAAHISELGMQMQELLAYVTPQMEKLYNENVITNEQGELFLAEKTFSVMSLFEQKEMMRRMLFEISGHRKDISLVHVEQMLALMANKEGKQQNCPYGVLAKRVRDGLLLMKLSTDVTFSDKNKQKDGQQKSDEQNLENLNKKNKKCGNHSEDKMLPVYLQLTAESEESKAEETIVLSNETLMQKFTIHFSILPWNGGKVAKRDCVKYFDYDKNKKYILFPHRPDLDKGHFEAIDILEELIKSDDSYRLLIPNPPLAKEINVDIILQSFGRDGTKDIVFTVSKDNGPVAVEILESFLDNCKIVCNTEVAKVSIVGAGMETHPGTASKMFEALYESNINIQMISTSEIKISVIIDAENADRAVSAVHKAFIPND